MANDLMRGRQVVVPLTNKSGGAVVAGDVVIVSSGTAAAFTIRHGAVVRRRSTCKSWPRLLAISRATLAGASTIAMVIAEQ